MARVRVGLLACALTLTAWMAPAQASTELSARSALVMDGQGHVLFQRNPNAKLPPASTTKVLTVLVALESANLDEIVTVSRKAANAEPSKLGIKPGETYTVRELCYAALLKSANDACVALAEHIAGSEGKFAVLMNRKARLLGAIDSHFANSNGLPIKNHYTTAKDLATILHAALQNPVFTRIATTTDLTLEWPGHHPTVKVHNKNKLLTAYAYPVLGKTGYTLAARHCYVGQTQAANPITVVLMGSQKLWPEAKRLLDLGTRTAMREVTAGGGHQVPSSEAALTY
ncbi:MAG TPA: D-alanyl-D-alanine carboxypeptidase family protein [Stenomitos sp.]